MAVQTRDFSLSKISVFSNNPVNHDVFAAQAAGYTDLVAPPTFPVVIQEQSLQQALADKEADIDFSNHGNLGAYRCLGKITRSSLDGYLQY